MGSFHGSMHASFQMVQRSRMTLQKEHHSPQHGVMSMSSFQQHLYLVQLLESAESASYFETMAMTRAVQLGKMSLTRPSR